MGKHKKKFIDKNKSVTFSLVNRSQHDPLAVDENAPQHVLMPISKQKDKKEDVKKENIKFGIYFDDDYNYLQHLREPGVDHIVWEEIPNKKDSKSAAKPKLQLPSSVFESDYTEREDVVTSGYSGRGPRPDWDPDIVEALDDDFNFSDPENELEDNFMEMAMAEGEDNDNNGEIMDDEDEDYDDIDTDDNNEDDDKFDCELKNWNQDDKKSKFTEYSMTSSVIRRSEQLKLLDDRFETFFDKYDDPELGPLENDDIEGHVDINDQALLQYAKEFEESKQLKEYKKEWDNGRLKKIIENESSDEEEIIPIKEDNEKKWDCESILSTYSNAYNHPKVIDLNKPKKEKKIEINVKSGIPMEVLNGPDNAKKLTLKKLTMLNRNDNDRSDDEETMISTISVLSIRPKNETPEEKRERKKLLKEYRNERRIEKKLNKMAFNDERMQQHNVNMHRNAQTKIVL